MPNQILIPDKRPLALADWACERVVPVAPRDRQRGEIIVTLCLLQEA